ncbi:MAG: aldehyde ferredoxin oxidoreductase family protein [Candidatus Thorarchaeota archaeon]
MKGYRGHILSVDLSTSKVGEIPLDEQLARQFLGGAGLACRLLYDIIEQSTDPLSPENPLLLMTGPFAGTAVPTGSKASLCSRSPQTGLWAHSTFGGHLGADLKFAGHDGLLITGRADRPSYLLVEDGSVEIRDASHLWGRDTQEVWDILREETGHRRAGVARIGVAGENLVKYAGVIVDEFRAAGRTGLGAVMGSKQLKAIVVHGSDRSVPVAEPERLDEYCKSLNDDKRETPTFQMYSDVGTAGFVDMAIAMWGSMPAGYYTVSDFDGFGISGATVKESILVGKRSCYRCPIACGRVIEITEGKYATGRFVGPEYETTSTVGSLILNDNLEALAFLNKEMDLLGIDTISAGNVIAFAYYLYNEGVITADDLDGIAPKWGDPDAAVEFVRKIAHREGVGDLMAEGTLAFGERFGVPQLAAQVNGLELPQHDPRAFSGMAVAYATSPRGACHMTGDMYNVQMGIEDEKWDIASMDRFANEADVAARLQDLRCVTNSLIVCHFYPVQSEELVELIRLVTGWDYTIEELKMAGERIFTLMRMFNLKMGYDPRNERLPEIILRPLEGPTEEHVPDVEAQLDKWYHYRGWDRSTGRPSDEQIARLGLDSLT